MRRSLLPLAATLSALTLLAVGATVAPSQSSPVFTVNDTTDAPDLHLDGACASTHLGFCTLRAAIQEAEHAGGGIVQLPPTGTGDYLLTIPPGDEGTPASGTFPLWNLGGDLDITSDIRVDGLGSTPFDVVIDGQGTHRIFDVHNACCLPMPLEHGRGSLWLRNLTLQNGLGDPDPESGHEHGGAIHDHGDLTLSDVAVINSSVTAAGWGGGGMTVAGTGVAQLSNVTVAGNSTGLHGGGIENLGVLRMLGVTIAENTAPAGKGGGIFLGLPPSGTPPTMGPMAATLVAKNTGGDCAITAGRVISSGSNLDGNGTCRFTHASDRTGAPGFDTSGVLGPSFYPLQSTSRAVDRGVLCQNHDIRGVNRAEDGNGDGVARCDAGSYEREATAPLTCKGAKATIYVDANGVIVGGPKGKLPYAGALTGTSGNDVIVGTTGRDRIEARGGNDLLCAGESKDLLFGGGGDDKMTGDAGADKFNGGPGNDTATDFNFKYERDTRSSVP